MNTADNQSTLRSLADELYQASGAPEDISTAVFGARPTGEANDAKDPRSDLRGSMERSLSRPRDLNGDLRA